VRNPPSLVDRSLVRAQPGDKLTVLFGGSGEPCEEPATDLGLDQGWCATRSRSDWSWGTKSCQLGDKWK